MDSHLIEVTTLGDLLLRAAKQWPDHEALVFPSERLTYAQLAERAKEQACALQGMGIQPGDHVGILAPNLVEVVEVLFGIVLSGAVDKKVFVLWVVLSYLVLLMVDTALAVRLLNRGHKNET